LGLGPWALDLRPSAFLFSSAPSVFVPIYRDVSSVVRVLLLFLLPKPSLSVLCVLSALCGKRAVLKRIERVLYLPLKTQIIINSRGF
jgi:hypothetical protein